MLTRQHLRFAALVALFFSVSTASARSPPLWRSLIGDATGNGLSRGTGPSTTPHIKWQTSQLGQRFMRSPPVVGGDGTIYTATLEGLVALDGATGAVRWQVAVTDVNVCIAGCLVRVVCVGGRWGKGAFVCACA